MSTPIQFKTINYRGGLVRFRIPTDWIEEYEPEGGGMFYADGPDTGTLRLNVLTSVREGGGPMEPAAEFLSNLSGLDRAATPVIVHSDGNASTSYWEFGEERGTNLPSDTGRSPVRFLLIICVWQSFPIPCSGRK